MKQKLFSNIKPKLIFLIPTVFILSIIFICAKYVFAAGTNATITYDGNGGIVKNQTSRTYSSHKSVKHLDIFYPDNRYKFVGWSTKKMPVEDAFADHSLYDADTNKYSASNPEGILVYKDTIPSGVSVLYAVWGIPEAGDEYLDINIYFVPEENQDYIMYTSHLSLSAGSQVYYPETLEVGELTYNGSAYVVRTGVGYIDNTTKISMPGYTLDASKTPNPLNIYVRCSVHTDTKTFFIYGSGKRGSVQTFTQISYIAGRTAMGTTGYLLTLGNQSTYSYGDETEHSYSFTDTEPLVLQKYTVRECGYTVEGYTFKGWRDTETGDIYQPGDVIVLGHVGSVYFASDYQIYRKGFKSTCNLQAIWEEIPHTISFNYNFDYTVPVTGSYASETYTADDSGVFNEGDTLSVTNGDTVTTLPTPSKNGYKFANWCLKEDEDGNGSGATISLNGTWVGTEDMTLYARWEPDYVETVLDPNASDAEISYSSVHTVLGTKYGELPEPTRPYYDFVGWVDSDNNTVTADSYVISPDTHTLYATWTPKKVTIFLVGNGLVFPGNKDRYETYVTYGTAFGDILDNIPTHQGMQFVEWNTAYDGSGTSVNKTDICTGKTSVTLYAVTTKNQYTVTLNYSENYKRAAVNLINNDVKTVTVTYGEPYPTLPIPSREGYIFLGWAKESEGLNGNGTGDYAQKGLLNTMVSTAGDHTLYAVWTPIYTQIIFDGNWDFKASDIYEQY